MYQELSEFGLSKNEILIYVTLLKTGLTTANRISKVTGLKRSTVYDNLNFLMNKGISSTIKKEKVNYYEAADPNKIVRILEGRKEKIAKIVPKLRSIKETITEKTGVISFEGKKGVITVLNDILDQSKDFWFYGSRKMALVALQHHPENFIQKRISKGISLKAVFAEEDRNDSMFKDKKIRSLSKVKFLQKLNQTKTNVFIYGKKIAFITSGENLVAVIINDKNIVDQQKLHFNLLWNIAKK